MLKGYFNTLQVAAGLIVLSAVHTGTMAQDSKDRSSFEKIVKGNRCGTAVWPPESGDVVATGAVFVFRGSSFAKPVSRNVDTLCSKAVPAAYTFRKINIMLPSREGKTTVTAGGKAQTDGSWAQEPLKGLN